MYCSVQHTGAKVKYVHGKRYSAIDTALHREEHEKIPIGNTGDLSVAHVVGMIKTVSSRESANVRKLGNEAELLMYLTTDYPFSLLLLLFSRWSGLPG